MSSLDDLASFWVSALIFMVAFAYLAPVVISFFQILSGSDHFELEEYMDDKPGKSK